MPTLLWVVIQLSRSPICVAVCVFCLVNNSNIGYHSAFPETDTSRKQLNIIVNISTAEDGSGTLFTGDYPILQAYSLLILPLGSVDRYSDLCFLQ